MPDDRSRKVGTPVAARNEVSDRMGRLLKAQTEGEVLFDPASCGRYATDASIYQIIPVGVFVPKRAEDIAVALEIARDLKVPILARGAGTSQCGQTTGAALVVDTSKNFQRILDVDLVARTATVEPGLVLDQLNRKLKPHGLWYPVDVSTSAQATLGGMAGNNSCGSRSIAYGNMVHNVERLSAWLSDGSLLDFGPVAGLGAAESAIAQFVQALVEAHRATIEARWPKVMRRVGGYNLDIFHNQSERPYTADGSINLAHLLVGSEGTLAFTKNLTLRLSELPRAKTLGVVNFPSFRQAMSAAQHIVRLDPTAVELVDRTMIELSRSNPAFRSTIEAVLLGAPEAILLVEFAGEEKTPLLRQLDRLDDLMGTLGLPKSVVKLVDPVAQSSLWEVRKAGLNIMMSLRGDGKPVSFIEDCAVPLEHLAAYTDALTEVFLKHGTRGTWYAHASVGTLHVRPILDMRSHGPSSGAAKMRSIAEEASELVRKFRGAYSGEHGDGLCRGEWIAWQFGPELNQAFRALKERLDPIGLFNPNRIVDPPAMDDLSLLRFQPPNGPKPYRTIALRPVFDWSAWNVQNDPLTETITAPGTGGDTTQGFAKAVEMCNNNGHCRKFDAGTMCPSFRVTGDEIHVTRGRANTLRLALSGQLGADAFTGQDVFDVMDLCVGCKGCRRECPTGVDMARMKMEFLAHYKRKHGLSMKDRLVSELPRYAAGASRLAWLLNLRDALPGAAWLSEKVTGLSAKRRLPRWRTDIFWRTTESTSQESLDQVLQRAQRREKTVALFVDTFNGNFETENVQAALRVLHSAGYSVHIPRAEQGALCCGRTYLATGRLEVARERLAQLTEVLLPLAQAGVPIVGLEPSCVLTLRDEALALGLGEAARTVSTQVYLFEEFVAREAAAGRFAARFGPIDRPILVHGHCHQKAHAAIRPLLDAVALVPGANPQLVETSCCGMAGSFGYEKEHYVLSMQMAEASLLPALRKEPGAIVVASGTSCRHQIADGASREAIHLALFLDQYRSPSR